MIASRVAVHLNKDNYLEVKRSRDYPKNARGKNLTIEISSNYPLGAMEQKLVAAARVRWSEPDGIVLVVSDDP